MYASSLKESQEIKQSNCKSQRKSTKLVIKYDEKYKAISMKNVDGKILDIFS